MAYKDFDASAILAVVIVVTAVTLLLIAGGMFFKMLSLRQGGAAVAASLGAVPVDPTTTDPQLTQVRQHRRGDVAGVGRPGAAIVRHAA